MTVQANESPATTPTPSTPAPTQGKSTPTRPERREKIVAALGERIQARQQAQAPDTQSTDSETEASATTPLGQPASDTGSSTPAVSARDARLTKLRESMQRRAEETAQRNASAAPPPVQPQYQAPKPPDEKAVAQSILAQWQRDPRGYAAAMRDAGIDPKKALDDLTNDSLSPGVVAAAARAEDGESVARRAVERVERLEQSLQERDRATYLDQEARQFVAIAEQKEGDDALFPLLSGLKPKQRYSAGLHVARMLEEEGKPFDLEELALATEEWLNGLVPSPPASTPVETPKTSPAAKVPKKKALPSDLVGESGKPTQKPSSLHERRALIRKNLELRMRQAAG